MWNSINYRAILPVACAVTGFVIACCLLLYSFIKSDLIQIEVRHATDLADTVVKSTRYAMLHDDRETLENIIKNIGEQQQVEHVRIFNKKGLVMFSREESEISRFIDKNAAGCNSCHAAVEPKRHLGRMDQARQFTNPAGDDVLAVTAPIYNDQDCSSAACHVHDARQSLLGTLDIGLSQEPLQRTMGMLQNRMIVFTGMILILTVGVACALLYRQILVPIKKLADFTDRQGNATFECEIPEVSGEMARLAQAFQGMARRLREAEKNGADSL